MVLNRPRATRLLTEAKIDAVVATSASNVAYVSDYLSDSSRLNLGVLAFALLPAAERDPLALVLPSLEVDGWAEEPGDVSDVGVYGTFYRDMTGTISARDDTLIRERVSGAGIASSAITALVDMLGRRGLAQSRLGVDEGGLTPAAWSELVAALPQADIVPASALLRAIRAVKTEEEIRRVRRSAAITSAGIEHVFAVARDGITERELARAFETKVIELGGSPGFALVTVGRRTSHTHSRRSDTRLHAGELIKQDMGCVFDLYWSDVGRTKVLGEATTTLTRTYEILSQAVRAAARTVRPGLRASEVFATAVGTVRELGMPDYRRHHTGHGVGITVYDLPLIQPAGLRDIFGLGTTDPTLEPGMIVNIETPYYRLGDFGMIVEDTVVVRSDGAEILTPLDYSLEVGR